MIIHLSDGCGITLLSHDEYILPMVKRDKQQLVRRGGCWPTPHQLPGVSVLLERFVQMLLLTFDTLS